MKLSALPLLTPLIACLLSGCSTITDTIAASTQTFTNTTESTTRISSGNSGTASLNNQQAIDFAKVNWMQLSANMANGEGEHLRTLADLMGVHSAQKSAFYSMTKAKFNQLLPSTQTTAEQLVKNLQAEVSKLNKV